MLVHHVEQTLRISPFAVPDEDAHRVSYFEPGRLRRYVPDAIAVRLEQKTRGAAWLRAL